MKGSLIQLSRGHLFALGVMSVALASVTFFLGLTIGARQVPAAEGDARTSPALVAAEVREGTLEVLLARVAEKQEATLTFPEELTAASSLVGDNGVPNGGWAVQVGEYPDSRTADAAVTELRAAKLAAYRIAAIVDGKRVERVRVGGYMSRENATASMPSVAERARAEAPVVVPAP